MALANDHPRYSKEEYSRRYREVRKHMREKGIDALVIYGDSGARGSHNANVKYLANYSDPISSYLVFPQKGNPALYMSNRLYLPYAKLMSVVSLTDAVDYDPAGKVERRLRQLGLEKGTIGLVGVRGILFSTVPYGILDQWKKNLKSASFLDATEILDEVRAVKSAEELKWFRKGAALTDMTFEAIEKKVKIGMTDAEITGVIMSSYSLKGGWPKTSFVGSTSMARPHIVFPLQQPSHRKIRKGDVILTELSAAFEEHSGQAHRPISVGVPPTPVYRKLYEVGVEAYNRILKALKPGADQEDVRRAASVIAEEGFTTFDTTFHGWGLLIEHPRVDVVQATILKRPQGKTVFREGMLMVVQPNVCTLDGKRGLQVGNLVEVTKTGARSLQKYPMKFMRI